MLHLLERADRGRFLQEVICGTEDPGLAAEFRRHAPVEWMPHLRREVSPRSDVRTLISLFRVFRKWKPDVVHGHTYKAGVLSSIAARHAGVSAVVFTPHGHIFTPGSRIPGVPSGAKLGLLKRVTRYAQSCADVVTALSEEDLQEQLSHRLSPRSRYVVIRNGIDVDRFRNGARAEARLRWGLDGATIVGCVGRLTEEKGHRFLLPMLRRLPKAVLVIVGDGPERAGLHREAERHGVGDRMKLVGEIDSAEILPAFDVYVQPSLYESQGLAILEAMAAGVPIVATRVGGVGAVVQEGRTGLLVPAADPEALAASVSRLLRERELTRSLILQGREMVEREFSVDRMVSEYERLYLGRVAR